MATDIMRPAADLNIGANYGYDNEKLVDTNVKVGNIIISKSYFQLVNFLVEILKSIELQYFTGWKLCVGPWL